MTSQINVYNRAINDRRAINDSYGTIASHDASHDGLGYKNKQICGDERSR